MNAIVRITEPADDTARYDAFMDGERITVINLWEICPPSHETGGPEARYERLHKGLMAVATQVKGDWYICVPPEPVLACCS